MRGVMNVTFGAIAACTLWAGAFVFIKIGVQWMPPLQFAGWRFLVSGLALAPWVPRASGSTWEELRLVAKRHVWLLLLMGLMQIGFKYAFFYLGLAFVPAALGAMLSGAGPVVVALVARSVSREESISRKMWGAIVLGGMGVAVLTLGRQRIGALSDYAPVGIALIILSNVVSALGDLAVSKDRKGLPPMLIASASLVVGGLGLLAVGIPTEGWRSPFLEPLKFYASLVALCCISSIGFAIWFTLLKRPFVRVVTLNFWKFLIPLLGSVFAWIVMPGERPTVVALLGMLLIVGALMLLSRDAHQSQ